MTALNENGSTGATTRPRMNLNEIRRADGGERQAPDRAIPDAIRPHYHQDGNAFRSAHRNDKIEFVDRGNRLHAYRPASAFTVRAIADTAKLRGWTAAEVTGDQEFKRRAYVELKSRGMEVRGYEATAKDNQILQDRADRRDAKGNPKVQAFVEAQDDKAMKAAVKKYPDLKDAFVARALVNKHAEGIDNEKGRENWKNANNDRLALAIHRGEKLPEPQLRQDVSQSKAAPAAGQDR